MDGRGGQSLKRRCPLMPAHRLPRRDTHTEMVRKSKRRSGLAVSRRTTRFSHSGRLNPCDRLHNLDCCNASTALVRGRSTRNRGRCRLGVSSFSTTLRIPLKFQNGTVNGHPCRSSVPRPASLGGPPLWPMCLRRSTAPRGGWAKFNLYGNRAFSPFSEKNTIEPIIRSRIADRIAL